MSGNNGVAHGFWSKENLENLTLPFRLISPTVTGLVFLLQVTFGVCGFLYVKNEAEFKEHLQENFKNIIKGQDEIKGSVAEVSKTIKENDRDYMAMFRGIAEDQKQVTENYRDWRESVEKKLTFLETKTRGK